MMFFIRILQVTMLRAKFGRIKTRTNLLQRLDNNFGHFNNKFCYKVLKKIYGFSDEIADCCLIRLATLPQKNCKSALKIFQKVSIRKFGIVDKVTDCHAQGPGFESSQRRNIKVSRLDKLRNCPFPFRARKSVNFNSSTKFFFVKFHFLLIPKDLA